MMKNFEKESKTTDSVSGACDKCQYSVNLSVTLIILQSCIK